MTKSITRRTALKAAPSVAAELQPSIGTLFREWETVRIASEGVPADVCAAGCARMDELAANMAKMPSRGVRDFALKLIAVTQNGEALGADDADTAAVLREMYAFAGLPLPPASASDPEPESEIMRLFREWKHLHAAYPAEVADIDEDDALVVAHNERIWAIEAQMLTTPCATMSDIVMKLAAHSNFGDLAVTNVEAPQIWAEVRRFVG